MLQPHIAYFFLNSIHPALCTDGDGKKKIRNHSPAARHVFVRKAEPNEALLTTYLEICDPSTYICVITRGRKLMGPFAGCQKEGADCVRMKAGERPERAAGPPDAPGRRSFADERPPRQTPSPG